jgi:hypothetical protein
MASTKAKLDWSNEGLLEFFTGEVKNRRVLCSHREKGKNFNNLAEYMNLCPPGSTDHVQGASLQSKWSDLAKDVTKKVIDLKGRPYSDVNYNEMAELKKWERNLLDTLCERDRFRQEHPTEAEKGRTDAEYLNDIQENLLSASGIKEVEKAARNRPQMVMLFLVCKSIV